MNFVPIDRRTLLAGTAGTLATAGLPLSARAARRDAEPSGLLHGLSPRPGLPERLPAEDPSRTLLSHGWLFHEGDIVPPAPQTHDETYTNAKAGNARGAAAMDYDDTDWAQVSVPHDWASAQGFVETANVAQGYRPRGIGWYRRTLRLEPEDRGRKLELHFGAIATAATIWINGSVVARNFSGYNAITIDLTPFARFGDELNVIAIRVDATAMEGWWYEGAGLYRHVWLAKRSPVSIATDGVHCDPRLGSDGRWTVPVSVALERIARAPATATIMVDLLDPTGKVVASARGQAQLQPLGGVEVSLSLPVDNPQRGSIERPALHRPRHHRRAGRRRRTAHRDRFPHDPLRCAGRLLPERAAGEAEGRMPASGSCRRRRRGARRAARMAVATDEGYRRQRHPLFAQCAGRRLLSAV